nr:DUF6309 family protein [Streptomyces sp. SAT1]
MLETLPSEAVLRRFAEDHTYDAEDRTNFNDRAERHLLSARRDMPGRWRRLLLEGPEVGKAVLPWHAGDGGQAELVPATGLTVFEAVDRLGPVVTFPSSARRAGFAASGACSGGPPCSKSSGECRALTRVLDVLGSGPGAASGGPPCSKSLGERAWRRGAGGNLTTGPSRPGRLLRALQSPVFPEDRPAAPGGPPAAVPEHTPGERP